jgi:threonyl-tRNA synthetase
LEEIGVRVHVDDRSEKMNAKIREHALQKVPFVLVVGDKEAAENKVSVRTRRKGDEGQAPTPDFVARIKGLIETKAAEI